MGAQMLTVELCGRLADVCGRQVAVPLSEGRVTVSAILAALADRHAPLKEAIVGGKVRACVNETIVAGDHPVSADDLVALFPPVSGG